MVAQTFRHTATSKLSWFRGPGLVTGCVLFLSAELRGYVCSMIRRSFGARTNLLARRGLVQSRLRCFFSGHSRSTRFTSSRKTFIFFTLPLRLRCVNMPIGRDLRWPLTPPSSDASRAAASLSRRRFEPLPLGIIQEPNFPRVVTSNTSALPRLLRRTGKAPTCFFFCLARFLLFDMTQR